MFNRTTVQIYEFGSLPNSFNISGNFEMCFTDGNVVVTCNGVNGFYEGTFNVMRSFGGVGCTDFIEVLNPNDRTNPEFSIELDYLAPRLTAPVLSGTTVMAGNRVCSSTTLTTAISGGRSNAPISSQRYVWQVSRNSNSGFVTFNTTTNPTTPISSSDITSRGFTFNENLFVRVFPNDDCSNSRVSEPVAISFLPPGPGISLSSTPLTCPGENGSIRLNITSGSGSFRYSIKNIANGQTANGNSPFTGTTLITSATINNNLALVAGTYEVSVEQNLGAGVAVCSTMRNVLISNPLPPDIVAVATQPTACVGGNNGSVVVEVGNIRDGQISYDILQGGNILSAHNNRSTNLTTSSAMPHRFTASGLSAGNYTIRVRDACNSDAFPDPPRTFTIPDGPALTISANPTPPTCLTGALNGSITATINSVGNGQFNYVLSGFSSASTTTSARSTTFTGLSPGTYNVSVTSSEGCVAQRTDIVITGPSGDFNIALDNPVAQVCSGGLFNLKVDVTQDPGVDNDYTYQLFDGTSSMISEVSSSAITHTFAGLTADNYRIDVIDNCRIGSTKTISHNVIEFDDVQIGGISFDTGEFFDSNSTPQTYHAECFGDMIAVRIPVTGGTGDHIITFNGETKNKPNGTPSIIFDVMQTEAEKDYTISVGNTCLSTAISQPLTLRQAETPLTSSGPALVEKQISGSSVAAIHITCIGDNDGQIEINVNGGLPPYDYRLFDDTDLEIGSQASLNNTATNHTFSNLIAGDYRVQITDDLGCQVGRYDVSVEQANLIDIVLSPSFMINVAGTDYHFQCKEDEITLTATIGNVTPSLYPLTAILLDQTSNTEIARIQVNNATEIAAFTFDQSLASVNYQVQVFDGLCLTPTTADITLREASQAFLFSRSDVELIIPDINVPYNVRCVDGADGEIRMDIRGGVPPYTYILTTDQPSIPGSTVTLPATTHTFTGLRATLPGITNLTKVIYTVEVRDALGCLQPSTAISDLELEEPTSINITPPVLPDENGFSLRCHGDEIRVEIPISGGAARDINDYLITLSNATATYTPNNRLPGRVIFNALPAAQYTIQVQDIYGTTCQVTLDPFFTITEPPVLTITEVNSANRPPVCLGHTDGTIQVTATGGLFTDAVPGENYEFAIISAVPTGAVLTPFDMTPVITNSNAVFSVPAGDFTIQVTDKNGCTEEINVSVPETATPLTLALGTVTEPACFGGNDGSITVSATDGSRIADPGDGVSFGYRFELTGANLTNPVVLFSGTGNQVIFNDLFATINPEGTDLPPYKIFVSDANNCSEVPSNHQFIDINSPSLIRLTADIFQPTCFNGTNGSLEITADGGQPPYEFSTNGIDFQQSPGGHLLSLPGLTGDSLYTIYVRDAQFNPALPVCIITNSFFVPDGPRLEISLIPDPVNCLGDSNGAIATFVSFSGNQDVSLNRNSDTSPGDFSFQWRLQGSPTVFSTDKDLNNLTAGTYEVTIRRNGQPCIGVASITITQPDEIFSFESITQFDASCAGKNDGFVNLSLQGGNTPARVALQFSLNGNNFQPLNGNTIAGLAAGNYNLSVVNAEGCQADTSFTIAALSPRVTVADSGNTSCFGGSDGFVVLSVLPSLTGRVLQNIEYGIDDLSDGPSNIVYQASPSFSGLRAGNYNFYARESGNTSCQGQLANAVTITQPTNEESPLICDPVIVFIDTTIDETCEGSNDGSLTLNVSGGDEPYTYRWSHDANLNFPQAQGLTADDYRVAVVDSKGAEASTIGKVRRLAPLEIVAINIDDVDCFGSNDGSIELIVTGGTGNYIINWSDGQTGQIASHLLSGTYNVTLQDARNTQCAITTTITVAQPEEVSAEITDIAQSTCNGGSDGQLTIAVSGGSGLFDIIWPDGQTGPVARQLSAGTYNVEITDRIGGCILNFSAELPETPAIIITPDIMPPTCFGASDGSISITLSNARNPFVEWFDDSQNLRGRGLNVTNLAAGNYTVEVTDADGCITSENYAVGEPALLQITNFIEELPLCNGDCNGSLSATVTGGTTPYTYRWTMNGALAAQGEGVSRVANLCAGLYRLTVTDANRCVTTQEVTLAQPDLVQITDITRIRPSCNGFNDGSIVLTLSGGTGQYAITWEDGTSGTTLSGVGAGTYQVNITDENNCQLQQQIELTEPDQLQFTAISLTEPTCAGDSDGSIAVTVTGGTIPFSYRWSDGQQTSTAGNLSTGEHTFTVTDKNGCLLERIFTLEEPNTVTIGNVVLMNPSCFGGGDGTIDLDVVGGSGQYVYSWSNGESTQDLQNLSSGGYIAGIQDINGCATTGSFELIDPDKLDIATLPGVITLCEGSSTELTAGEGWVTHQWTRNGDPFSDQQKVNVSLAGDYRLETVTALDCEASKDFVVETGTMILNADFIFDSEIVARDTVVMVDVSWPIPERVEWMFPGGMAILTDTTSFYQEVVFESPGTYVIGLMAHIGDCFDYIEKSIVVIDPADAGKGDQTGGRTGQTAEDRFDVSVTPNPNNGFFRVVVEQDLKAEVKISLFGFQSVVPMEERILTGRTVYSELFEHKDLHAGLYFIVAERGEERRVVRFIVR